MKNEQKVDKDDNEAVAFSTMLSRNNPRICIRKPLIAKLVALGIPDDAVAISAAVNDLTDMSIESGAAYLPQLTDVITVQKGVNDRIEELTLVNLQLLKLLAELGAIGEYRSIMFSLKQQAKETVKL